jgi:hypothetical protein
LLYDQLNNHRFNYQHQKEIKIPKPNEYIKVIIIIKRSRATFNRKRYQTEPLNNLKVITRELDKGRGARTTSIKTLPTLVPLVMCFDYKKVAGAFQDKRNRTDE